MTLPMQSKTVAGVPGAVYATDVSLPSRRQGKVRDVYTLPTPGGSDRLLIVASDRISAFDVVMPTPIPGKGALLTEVSVFWLRLIERLGIVKSHLLSTDADEVPDAAFTGHTTRRDLDGRVMIGMRCRVIPIECVVRGYLEGSGWKDYQQTGAVCGVKLPAGMQQCARLPEPIFTPATKEEQGKHDENISYERACELVGEGTMRFLREKSLAIYGAASEHARSRGIIIADTKFEFGIPIEADGSERRGTQPILIDEVLTPDSSRFWPVDRYEPGRPQASFDKQFLREYLETLVAKGAWNKQAPGPELPSHIVEATLAKYREGRDRLVG